MPPAGSYIDDLAADHPFTDDLDGSIRPHQRPQITAEPKTQNHVVAGFFRRQHSHDFAGIDALNANAGPDFYASNIAESGPDVERVLVRPIPPADGEKRITA
jgi:hypothetical protein